MDTHNVLGIFRVNEPPLAFVICISGAEKKYYRVHRSLSERISKGMVFIGDRIKITDKTDEGIVFEVVAGDDTIEAETDMDFFYSEEKKVEPQSSIKNHYLPYLCDVLPYSTSQIKTVRATPIYKGDNFVGKYQVDDLEVSNIRIPVPNMFIAKVVQKTRINTYPTLYNPFFFLIVSSNNILLKVVLWSESLKDYSNVRVGDIVMIKEFKSKKKWSFVDKVDPNTFTESAYFDVEEITAKDFVKVVFDKKAPVKYIFEAVEGRVEYISVLMRHNCNGSLMEYVLLRVSGKLVVFFYNSDSNFYKIQAGCTISITELRKVDRAGVEMYISTIYTQFELEHLTVGDLPENTNTVIPQTADENHRISKKLKTNQEPAIFGAIGFIPDSFTRLSDVLEYFHKEKVNSREITVNMLMKPILINLTDIPKQPLVLNESKKFVVNSKITKITDTECVVDYYEDGKTMKQRSFSVILEDQFEVFVYDNFFTGKIGEFLIGQSDKVELVGKSHYFVIEVFRVDENSVIHYLTGIIPEI